ncbi:MAG: type II toxin-antitoxin system HicA family toxin [FCB group bacterium]|nr:type II toxin-antitoxin system HicA family toxin [FCB group bacterium]
MSPRLPIIKPKVLIRALKRCGYIIDHQTGSHVFLKHPDNPTRIATIPYHNRDLAKGTLKSILRQTEMSVDDLIELL